MISFLFEKMISFKSLFKLLVHLFECYFFCVVYPNQKHWKSQNMEDIELKWKQDLYCILHHIIKELLFHSIHLIVVTLMFQDLIHNKLEYVSSDFVGISMGKLLPNITIGFFMRGYIDFMTYVGFTEKYKTMYISTFDQCPFIFSQDNNDYNFKLVPNQQSILWYPNPNLKFVNISTYYGSSKGNMISNIDSTGRSTIYRIDGYYIFDSNNGMAVFQYQGISPISSKYFRFIPIASGYDHYFEYQQIIHYDDNPTNIYKYPLPTITSTPRKTEISFNTLIIIGIITLEAMIITTLSNMTIHTRA